MSWRYRGEEEGVWSLLLRTALEPKSSDLCTSTTTGITDCNPSNEEPLGSGREIAWDAPEEEAGETFVESD